MNFIKRIKAKTIYRQAVEMADKLHEEQGKRFYVMLSTDDKRLIVMDRKQMHYLRQKRYMHGECRVADLERGAVYYTAYKNGDGYLTKEAAIKRRDKFISWYVKS